MYCRAVRALQEPGRAACSLLLCRYLWREDQQSQFVLPGHRRLDAQRCAVEAFEAASRTGKKAAMRPHMNCSAFRVLQEAGRSPTSLLLSSFLWRAEQQSLFNLPDLKSSMPSSTNGLLCCAVAELKAAFRTSTTKERRCGLTGIAWPS